MDHPQDADSPALAVSLSEVAGILLRSARLVLLSGALALAVGGVLSALQKPAYRAQATLLPEEVSSRSLVVPSGSQGIPFWPLSSPTTQVFYTTILRSRAVAEMVCNRLGRADGSDLPGGADPNAAATRLLQSVTITEEPRDRFYTRGGLITIRVETDDPMAACDIANTYAFVLDEYLTENAVTSASRVRQFLERRLEETNAELEAAQLDLQRFQEQYGAISVDQQATATIELLSELEAQRVGLSVEKEADQERFSSAHSSVRSLQARIDALKETIDRLTYSREPKVAVQKDGEVEFYVPLQMIPELSFEASRKLLTVKTKQEIVGLFGTRVEQAKIDEASNLPSISVLDLARVGVRVRPRWKLNLAVALGIGLLVGAFGAWGRHYGRAWWDARPPDSEVLAAVGRLRASTRTAAGKARQLGSRLRPGRGRVAPA